jgi:hypothetical protein
MTFARRVFTAAWIYGLVVLVPMVFLERQVMEQVPPPLAHPEFYYGFLGAAIAWQLVFRLIAHDPARFRPVILPALVEKLSWGIGVLILAAQGRTPRFFVVGAAIDLVLAVLFVVAWRKTREAQ